MASSNGLLVLADGTSFPGRSFGFEDASVGEVVFNTSMSGYQEILTDPSYSGQIVTMTAPHIGNYGTNDFDVESSRVGVAGFVVREASRIASNFRSTMPLPEYLRRNRIVAITDVDTRALTLKLRTEGAQMGIVAHGASVSDVPALLDRIHAAPAYDTIDYVSRCSVETPTVVRFADAGRAYAPLRVSLEPRGDVWPQEDRERPLIVVLDYGVKFSILRNLHLQGYRVLLLPHNTPAAAVLAEQPAGLLLSNGPGDPALMNLQVGVIAELVGKVPIFGICLGHQLLGRALGGSTFKLKFGHRGPNQPVLDKSAGRVQITSQNHGYAVRLENLSPDITVTHVNLNDQTIEGIALHKAAAFSVQHHPEAGPGPHDALVSFLDFRDAVSRHSAARPA